MAEITWKGYLELLDGLTKTLERLTGVEELKTAAASRGGPARGGGLHEAGAGHQPFPAQL